MNAEEKIINFLKNDIYAKKSKLSDIDISESKNKNDENLLFVRAYQFEKKYANSLYKNDARYYGFNQDGEYVGCVIVSLTLKNELAEVELEAWSAKIFKNRGNMSVLAKEVIKDIFEKRMFDGLKVGEPFPPSNIKSITVSINKNNFPSLAMAKKLGFDEYGYLNEEDYFLRGKNFKNK